MDFSKYKPVNNFTFDYHSVKEKRYREFHNHFIDLNAMSITFNVWYKSIALDYIDIICRYSNIKLVTTPCFLTFKIIDNQLHQFARQVIIHNFVSFEDFINKHQDKTIYLFDICENNAGKFVRCYIED